MSSKSIKWTIIIGLAVIIEFGFFYFFALPLSFKNVNEHYIIYAPCDSVVTAIRHHKSTHRELNWKIMVRDSVIENSTHDVLGPGPLGDFYYTFNFYYELRVDGQRYVFHGFIDMRDTFPTYISFTGVMPLEENREWGTWKQINDRRDFTVEENERFKRMYEIQVLDSLGLKWKKDYLDAAFRKFVFRI